MLKKAAVLCLLLAGIAFAALTTSARAGEEKAKGDKVNITGRFACTFCTLAHPDKPCDKACCTTCIKAGDPASLVTKEGDIYILLSGEQGAALMTPARMQMLGANVAVKGLLVKVKGMQAIYVDSIEKAP